jgi:hypothetical protein
MLAIYSPQNKEYPRNKSTTGLNFQAKASSPHLRYVVVSSHELHGKFPFWVLCIHIHIYIFIQWRSNEMQPGVAQHRHNRFTQTKMSECSYLLAYQRYIGLETLGKMTASHKLNTDFLKNQLCQ